MKRPLVLSLVVVAVTACGADPEQARAALEGVEQQLAAAGEMP